jgi:MYXO-CTERM domain-containing protein
MKQNPNPLRRATGLLLAAAALPLTPLAAQDTQAQDPAASTTPAPDTTTIPDPVVTSPEPVTITPTPAPVATAPATTTTPAATTAETPTVRRTAPTRTTAATRSATRTARPAPAAPATAPLTVPIDSAPITEAPVPSTQAPEVLPAETLPVTTEAAPAQAEERTGSILPWLIGGLALLGALALLFSRRRRRESLVRDEVYESAPVIEAEPVAAAPIAATETGRPWLDLQLNPARAGVTGQEAQVEFELAVQNTGTAAARDVRISTWMVAGGATQETEMERLLIERPGQAADSSLPEVTIEAGAGKRIETAVALSTAGLTTDAVLPVVVAEARYRLPDGSEGFTSARYAVSVPFGEELSHFDIENPSGLHEGVEAWPLGEVERA